MFCNILEWKISLEEVELLGDNFPYTRLLMKPWNVGATEYKWACPDKHQYS